MTWTFLIAGVVLAFTVLRLIGDEREHAERRKEAEIAIAAMRAAEAEALAILEAASKRQVEVPIAKSAIAPPKPAPAKPPTVAPPVPPPAAPPVAAAVPAPAARPPAKKAA